MIETGSFTPFQHRTFDQEAKWTSFTAVYLSLPVFDWLAALMLQ